MKNPEKFVWAFFAILLFILSGCDTQRLYDQSLSIPDDGWHKDSATYFQVNVDDTIGLYNFYINLRHSAAYRFSNFYLFLNSELPNGNITRDTIELILADHTGKWLGKGFGSIKDNQVLVRKNLRFPLKGTYKFSIEQGMRKDLLKGIKDVGIRVEHETGKQ
nr:gliding motility lipoprotein GldH [Bacteroidota bacterium]